MARRTPDEMGDVDALPLRFQYGGARRREPLPEGGFRRLGAPAGADSTDALALLDVGRARGHEVAGGAAYGVRRRVPEPHLLQELGAGIGESRPERVLRA